MTKFASGKNAFAISDRSGFRYRYKDMRREWNGALVGRDEFEAKQPQLGPFRKVIDAQALRDARPQSNSFGTTFGQLSAQSPQPVHKSSSTYPGCCKMVAIKFPAEPSSSFSSE